MPPKPKFTKEEITSAALHIVSAKGTEALTARELGKALGSSARPIFTVFENMEELQKEVREEAMRRFERMRPEAEADMPIFKQVGMKMVLFGMREPKLYRLLFMQDNQTAYSFDELLTKLGAAATRCMEAIERDYGLSRRQSKMLFEHVWIYTFGIGALCATGGCRFSEQELGEMLTTEFRAVMTLIQSENQSENQSEKRFDI